VDLANERAGIRFLPSFRFDGHYSINASAVSNLFVLFVGGSRRRATTTWRSNTSRLAEFSSGSSEGSHYPTNPNKNTGCRDSATCSKDTMESQILTTWIVHIPRPLLFPPRPIGSWRGGRRCLRLRCLEDRSAHSSAFQVP
jgi:hypothetical protein